MTFNDEQLRDAVEFLWQQYYENLPDVANYYPDFSEEFSNKMNRLCAHYKRQMRIKTLAKNVAAIALVILILGGSCLATSPVARAALRNWIVEIYEDIFIYHFFENSTQNEWNDYEITALPQGYTNTYVENTAGVCTKLYQQEDTILAFVYHKTDESLIHAVRDEQRTITQVDGLPADFYSSHDGSANTLVWIDEKTQTVFSLSGFFEQEKLIEIAESIQIQK